MSHQLFVNLPVKDLEKSKAFFESLGFSFNPLFTDENAGCMVLSETNFVMLLTETYFKTFIKKDLADAQKTTEVINAVSFDSKEKVNELADKALAAGGSNYRDPQDYGFMYQRSFYDLDGHAWEFFWMDPAGPPQQ